MTKYYSISTSKDSVESKSTPVLSPGFTYCSKQVYDSFIAALPPPPTPTSKTLQQQINELKTRIDNHGIAP